MKRLIQGTLAVLMALAVAQTALYAERGRGGRGDGRGQGKHDMRGPHHGGPFFGDPARMQKELGLTDEQVKKITAVNQDHRKKMLDLREKLAPKKIQVRKLLLEDTVDLGRVRAVMKESADIRVDLNMLKIQHRLEIEKVLTAEQKAKMKNHRMRMMKKKDGRGPGPMPDRD